MCSLWLEELMKNNSLMNTCRSTHWNKSCSHPSRSSQLSESSIKPESLKCSIRVKPCTSRRLSLYMPLGSASFLPTECCNSLPTPHNPSASVLPPPGTTGDPWLLQPPTPSVTLTNHSCWSSCQVCRKKEEAAAADLWFFLFSVNRFHSKLIWFWTHVLRSRTTRHRCVLDLMYLQHLVKKAHLCPGSM